jgi:hypothetical protein
MLQVLAQATSDGSAAIGWVFIIGMAVIFGAWSANAAERKGYPRSTGWLLGGLLGLLGRIIVGVMRDKTITPTAALTPTATTTPACSDLR